MRKLVLIFGVLAMLLIVTPSAQAGLIQDVDNGEMHLYQIVNTMMGTNYTSNAEMESLITFNETLPNMGSAYHYELVDYAKFAGFSPQQIDWYVANFGSLPPPAPSGIMPLITIQNNGINADGIKLISFGAPYYKVAFVDTPGNQGYSFSTEKGDNPNNNQQGLIFQINFDYIIAFEDIVLENADKDYNDAVFHIRRAGIPLPPSVFLLGSGLLGVAGWRRFRKG
jgi:hypothetical protein